jgi:TIR domain
VKRERIFISYRRADTAGHAGRLSADLTRLLGPRAFMDVSSIAPGDEFERAIDEQLRSCGAVLAVIGPASRAAFAAHGDGKDYGVTRTMTVFPARTRSGRGRKKPSHAIQYFSR